MADVFPIFTGGRVIRGRFVELGKESRRDKKFLARIDARRRRDMRRERDRHDYCWVYR